METPYNPPLRFELPYKLELRFELPDDVLQIIKEYSMPLTRPDWRTLHIMPQDRYHSILLKHTLLYSTATNMSYIKIKRIRFWIKPIRRRTLPFLEPIP